VLVDIKLSESENRLREVENKSEVLHHTVREKQAICEMQQTHIDVSGHM